MKTYTRIPIIIAAMVLVVSFTINAATYITGLSPYYPPPDREAVTKGLLLFVLEGAATGDNIIVYDALNLQPVCQFKVSEDTLFQRNARARVQRFKTEIVALQTFLTTDRPHAPELTGVIHVPEFLNLAGAQLRSPGEPARVIILGSPFYANTDEPAFDMHEAVPSDAHLTAAPNESIFSTAQKRSTLRGITVHHAYLHECFVNSFHQERITRFWSLYAQHQEGALVTFAPDIGLAFERARANVQQPCVVAKLDAEDSKIEMRRVVPRSLPTWFGPTNIPARVEATLPSAIRVEPLTTNATSQSYGQPISNRLSSDPGTQNASAHEILSIASAPLPVTPSAGVIGIGIMWDQKGCDFDLWVRPTSASRELSYRNSVSREGRYFHDYRDRNASLDYEYVELKSEIDVQKIRAFVNFYAGKTATPSGVMVLHYRGNSYRTPFTLKATSGNHGGDANRRGQSPHWVELDLSPLLTASGATAPAQQATR